MPTEDVYNLYDLGLTADSGPGMIFFVRVRSRTEKGARSLASQVAGREGRDAWKDPEHTTCRNWGPAAIQWAGVVTLSANGLQAEKEMVRGVIADGGDSQ